MDGGGVQSVSWGGQRLLSKRYLFRLSGPYQKELASSETPKTIFQSLTKVKTFRNVLCKDFEYPPKSIPHPQIVVGTEKKCHVRKSLTQH